MDKKPDCIKSKKPITQREWKANLSKSNWKNPIKEGEKYLACLNSNPVLIDILLHQTINKDYKEKILLDPGSKKDCRGEYELGKVIYPDKTYAYYWNDRHRKNKPLLSYPETV